MHVLSNGSVPLDYGFRLVNTKNSVKHAKNLCYKSYPLEYQREGK